LSAVRLAMSYSAGKPQAPPDPDTLDAHELNTHLTNTTPHGAEHRLLTGVPLRLLLEMLPAALAEHERAVAAALRADPEPNPPAPFPLREGGERLAAGHPGNGEANQAGSPPSFSGKGAGGLGQGGDSGCPSAAAALQSGACHSHPLRNPPVKRFSLAA